MTRRQEKRAAENEASGKSSGELSPEDAWEIAEEIRALHTRRWRLNQSFIDSVQSFEPLERAEAWLRYVAENEDIYVCLEAVVYLVSRGHDCTARIRDIISTWKTDEKQSLDTYMYEQRLRFGKDVGHIDISEALAQSRFGPRAFWESHPPQEPSFLATMLRTVEWCNIGGFDHWWHSETRQILEGVFRIGIEPLPSAFFLFDLCRSDYTLELMPDALERLLDAVWLTEPGQLYPWRIRDESTHYQAVDCFPYAASMIFAQQRIHPFARDIGLVREAAELLLRHQNPAGYWQYLASDSQPDIWVTAMVVHALALYKPRGWEIAANLARDWLWSVQDISGCWIEFGYESVDLTVLVLDALELIVGSTKITFNVSSGSRNFAVDGDSPASILHRLDAMDAHLGTKLDDIEHGQAAIYRYISSESKHALSSVLDEIRQGRIEQGELQRTVDSIRRALKRIQDVGLPVNDSRLTQALDQIYAAVNSSLPFQQKLELCIPIIPLLLEYKVELGGEIDLEAVWRELVRGSPE